MIITEKAKEALLKEFDKLHKDLLVISSDKDNPSSLSIEVVDSKDKSYEVMSGIKVSIEEDIKELFDHYVVVDKVGLNSRYPRNVD